MHRDRAAVLLDDVANDREAQAGALAIRLGREERLEDPLAVLVAYARARVADLEEDGLGGGRARLHDHLAAVLDRMDGLGDQVDEDLLELTRDRLDDRQ